MVWTPNKINFLLTESMHDSLQSYSNVLAVKESLGKQGWIFWVVNQNRGRCYYEHKVITIPSWVYASDQSKDYHVYYLAHEMAHTQSVGDHHGPRFMAAFMRICPESLQHHEIGYKPKNAIAAGISMANLF